MSANNNNGNNKQKKSSSSKGQEKKLMAMRMPQVKDDPVITNPVADYAYRLIDPFATDPELSPSPVPTRGTAVKDKIVRDVKDRYVGAASQGQLYGEVFPSLDNTLWYTANNGLAAADVGSSPQSLVAYADVNKNWQRISGGTISGPLSVNTTADPQLGTSWAVYPTANTHIGLFDITHNCVGHAVDVRVELYRSDHTLEATATASDVQAGIHAQLAIPVSNWQTAGTTAYIVMDVKSSHGASFDVQLSGCTSSTTQFFGYLDDQSTSAGESLDVLQAVPKLQSFRLTAMGILGSYQGSDLSNGGRVACARVPRSWTPDEEDLLSAIAKLPYDSYEGALKDGFHMHWLPSTLDDLKPQDGVASGAPPLYKYVFAIAADDKTQSFRLRITAHIEYFSTSPSYGAMRYPPPGQSLSTMLHYLALSVPVATSNDSHVRRKILNFVKGAGKSGLAYVLAHPEMLASVAAAL